MKNRHIIVVATLGLLIIGCAADRAYEGPGRPRNEVAIFIGMNPVDPLIPKGWASLIKKVDGNPVQGSGAKVEVLAGKRELEIYCSRPGGAPSTQKVTVEVEAGGEYTIGVKPVINECQINNRRLGGK